MHHEITANPPSEFYQLRARVFREALGWNVIVDEHGEERDRYDPALSVLVWDTTIAAGFRLLPTTGPTLMSDVFGDAGLVSGPYIWECSRLCFRPSSKSGELRAAMQLNCGLADAIEENHITSLAGNLDSTMMSLYRRAGFKFDILGHTDKCGPRTYFCLFDVSRKLLYDVNARLKWYLEHLEAV